MLNTLLRPKTKYIIDDTKFGTSKYKDYSLDANPLENCYAKVFQDMFEVVSDFSTVYRDPVLLHIEPKTKCAAAAMDKVFPRWKGRHGGLIFKVPCLDASAVNIGIELAQYREYPLMLNSTRPSDGLNSGLVCRNDTSNSRSHVLRAKLQLAAISFSLSLNYDPSWNTLHVRCKA